jgi:ketosteroid isomerase-like protein
MPNPSKNLETARRYLKAVEEFATGAALAAFFSPDVVHVQFPNRVVPHGSRCNLPEMVVASGRGKKEFARQRYEIRHEVANGDTVALEVFWEGTLAVPFDTLPAGEAIRAHFAVILEFRGGKIVAQRNYDCYEPW